MSTYSAFALPEDAIPITRNKGIDPLLFDLLEKGIPSGIEHQAFKTIMPKGFTTDEKGNFIYQVGKDTETMFSSHLDTVHKNITKVYPHITDDGYVYGAEKENKKFVPSILGADDKLGVWLMLNMMSEKIPGLYVFHTGEERGGIGSRFIAASTPSLVKNIKRCIALDRKDINHIITEQSVGVCCSDKFADALSLQLNKNLPTFINFHKDDTGTFTDSASYTKLIEECTNISVGYYDQHTRREKFDYIYLYTMLLPALLKVDWESLPTERDKTKVAEIKTYHYLNEISGPTRLGMQEHEKIMNTTPWDKLPLWSPYMATPEGIKEWKLAILLKKYISEKGIENSVTPLAQTILKSVPKVDEVKIKTLETEILELKNSMELLEQEITVYHSMFGADTAERQKKIIERTEEIEEDWLNMLASMENIQECVGKIQEEIDMYMDVEEEEDDSNG